MAELGNLWYNLGVNYKKETLSKAIADIKRQLETGSFNIKIDKTEVTSAGAKSFIDSLEKKAGTVNLSSIKLGVDRKHVQDELKAAPFQVDLALNVKQMQVQDAIRQAFEAYGMNWNGLTAAQARSVRSNQLQQRQDDLHAESLLRQQRIRQSINHELSRSEGYHKSISGQMKTTTQMATILGNTIGNVFSVYAVRSFLNEIVKVGGEIQKQNLAMENILGDSFKAHENYQRIKNLAVISPFTVQDLTTYSRRLSAFGVQYNELYDTMKRLADISAGVGTDFSRIALVYGETLERTFLDAKLLRQFSYAGIPMIQKLQELYTARENSIVTGSDVRKRITNREVSFEDVNEVIKNLTSEGGKFYNMQEAMAESLATKWNNVGVAMDIAFANMADGALGNGLKVVAETLTAMARSYQQVITAMMSATTGIMAYKTAQLIMNKALTSGANASLKNALAEKQRSAQFLEVQSRLRTLTAQEKELVATKNQLTMADYKHMAAEGALNKESLTRLWITRDTNKVYSMTEKKLMMRMALMSGMTKAEIRQLATTKAMSAANLGLSLSFKAIGASLKALMFNPFFMIFAGMEAVMAITTHFNDKAEESAKRVDAIGEAAAEGARNLDELMNSDAFKTTPTSSAGFKTAIDEMKSALKDYAPDWQNTFTKIFGNGDVSGLKSQEAQYYALKDAIEETAEAYHLLGEMKNVVEHANDASEGIFDHSMIRNLKDYQDTLKELGNDIRDHAKNYEYQIKFLEAARAKNESFAKAALDGNGKLRSVTEQLTIMATQYQSLLNSMVTSTSDTTWRGMNWLRDSASGVTEAYNTAKADVSTALDDIMKQFKQMGLDPTDQTAQKALKRAVDITLNDSGVTDPAARELLYSEFVSRHMTVFITQEWLEPSKGETDLQKLGIAAVNKTGGMAAYTLELRTAINNKIKANEDPAAIAEALSKMKKEYEAALGTMVSKNDTTKALNVLNQKSVNKRNEGIKMLDAAAAAMGLNIDTASDKKNQSAEESRYIKELRNRIKLVKEAYDEYKKLRDAYGSDSKAVAKMKNSGLFSAFFNDKGNFNPKDIRANYEKILKEIGNSNDPTIKSLALQLTKDIFDFDLDTAKENMKNTLDALKEEMSRIEDRWNLFDAILGNTGDRKYALATAFSKDLSIWDDVAAEWATGLRTAMEKNGGYTFDNTNPFGIDWNLDLEKARQYFGEFYDIYKQIKDRIDKNGITLYTNISSTAKTLETIQDRIRAIEDERDQTIAQLTAKGESSKTIEMANQMFDDQIRELKRQLFEGSDIYKKLNEDTTNFGKRRLKELLVLARNVKAAIQAGEVTDKDGKRQYSFTYDGTEYNETEEGVNKLFKLLEKLEKKADTVTEAFKRLFSGKTKNGDAATFGDYAKDLSSVFSYVASVTDKLSSFDTDSGFGKLMDTVSKLSGAMSTFATAAEKFDSGDYAGGTQDALSASLQAFQAVQSDGKDERSQMEILVDIWNELIAKKKEYMKLSTASDVEQYAQDAAAYVEKQIAYYKQKAAKRLTEGKSWGSDNMSNRMWRGSYTSDLTGNTWNDVANDIESRYGVQFKRMSDLLNMDANTLQKIKEEYPDLWAAMDDDFREYLDALIAYGDELEDIKKKANEALTDTTFDQMRSAFDSAVKDMDATWTTFTDNFEEQLYNAIVNQQLNKILGTEKEGVLADYYQMFADYMASDGGLDQTEIEELKRKYEEIAKQVYEIQGEASKATGWDGGSASSSLSSSIQGVSADEVGAMSAYLNGIRADTAIINATASAQLAQLNMQTEYLRMIQESNAATMEYVESLRDDVRAVTNGTKSFSIS